MSNPLKDMEKPDVIFCIGTNMTECHPVAATRLKRAIANGAKMIVADPRVIGLVEHADMHLRLRVGSDAALLLGMAHVIAREGLVDEGFIHERTTEAEAFLDHVKEFTPEWASTICEVPPELIEEAALLYARADRGAPRAEGGRDRLRRGARCRAETAAGGARGCGARAAGQGERRLAVRGSDAG